MEHRKPPGSMQFSEGAVLGPLCGVGGAAELCTGAERMQRVPQGPLR